MADINISRDQILNKIRRFCSYQDRCTEEVRVKLCNWNLKKDDVESIIEQLAREGFVNEELFAVNFTRGKFRIKKWGKQKIQFELRKKNIAAAYINKAVSQINDNEYFEILINILEKKNRELKKTSSSVKFNKLFNFAVSKGFEKELVYKAIEEEIL